MKYKVIGQANLVTASNTQWWDVSGQLFLRIDKPGLYCRCQRAWLNLQTGEIF